MTLFITYGQNLYNITRETPKTIFYKSVKPNKSYHADVSIVYHCRPNTILSYFNPDELQLDEKEYKMLKTKFDPSNILSPDELRNTFFKNDERVPITDELKLNHAFFHNDNFKLLKETYMIRYFIYSLTSRHLHAVIKHRNDESYKKNI